jgi:hypothetical protein
MARRKGQTPHRGFYDRPLHQRLATKVFEGLVSYGAVYLLSPFLLELLAPVQANINAKAAQGGASVSNVGASAVANKLIAAAAS